jgi:hypothetical protein
MPTNNVRGGHIGRLTSVPRWVAGVLGDVGSPARSFAAGLVRWSGVACDRPLLAELNDYQLRDVGLVRSGVVAHMGIPAWWACPRAWPLFAPV